LLSGWSNTRVAVRCGWRAYSWQYSAGEAYESIGVNGNHVVLAIGVTVWRVNRPGVSGHFTSFESESERHVIIEAVKQLSARVA